MSIGINQPIFRRRGTDHLGFLGGILRNLMGYTTLAHELIQNADDAPETSSMVFDVRDDALIVDNDGSFTDCGLEEDECPWKRDPFLNRMCDFHRFQIVAGGDKRDEPDTTGAFGIGFTAVYQITDRPELISSKRHWIIDEIRREEERISECPGCSKCKTSSLAATRFILPWARDPQSQLRERLRVDAIHSAVPDELLGELMRSLPLAMLFLKKLCKITVLRNGKAVAAYERLRDGDSLIVSDGKNDSVWHCFHADFATRATALRAAHPGKIEAKRSSIITVAVPADRKNDGVFCAFLPTQQTTGLPFHINADFFPKSDRKEIVLENDYQSNWNRAAVGAAAEGLVKNLTWLRDRVGHRQLWQIIDSIEDVSREADRGQRDQSLKQFWQQLSPILGSSRVIYSSKKQWLTASESLYLEREQEAECLPVFEGLGLQVVHNDLRFAQNLLVSKTVGVRLLDGRDLARALRGTGLNTRVTVKELPACLRAAGAMKLLWSEVKTLLDQVIRRERANEAEVARELASCAMAPATDGAFWPCNQVFRAGSETVELFQPVLIDTPFLDASVASIEALESLCPSFDAKAAIESLAELPADTIVEAIQKQKVKPRDLLKWFEDRHAEIVGNTHVRDSLANLPLFPSSAGPKVLAELSLPGDFTDPLGLADVVDLQALGGRRQFLRDLGAKELTFETYARDHVPRALADATLNADKRRQVIRLLSDHLGQIRDDDETREELTAVAIVECSDGVFRSPNNVYFASDVVAEVLGGDAKLALIPTQHADAVKAFYSWLGVATQPRLAAIVKRIEQITSNAPTNATVDAIRVLFGHLAARAGGRDAPALAILKSKAWIPARWDRERWYKPTELFADFNAYLFESQATFLDISQRVQQDSTELLTLLGVRVSPTETQVVAHLLHCAVHGATVNREVYRWLNDRHSHPAISRLEGQPCLMLDDGQYVRPRDVFWQPHPFGCYRHQLGTGLRKYNELLTRLGIKESPDCSDAFAVLRQLSESFGTGNHLLDADAQGVVLGCWQMLDRGLDHEQISNDQLDELRAQKVICAPNNVLVHPEILFFDDRPGLAAKFGEFLQNSVIQRPQGAWRAMAEAGVRALSEAVESQLAEKTDPVEDAEIRRRSTERRALLTRVLDFHRSGLAEHLDRLNDLRSVAAKELVVTYTVRAYGRDVQSPAEPAQAHFWRADNTLYFARRDGQPPWTAVARELAAVLSPEEEPGRLASFIKDVLAPDDAQAAKAVLDELGIPDLALAPVDVTPESAPVAEFGVESEPPADDESSAPGSSFTSLPTGRSGFGGHSNSEDQPSSEERSQDSELPETTDDAIAALLGDNAAGPTPLPGELDRPDRPTSSRPGSHTGTRSTSPTPGDDDDDDANERGGSGNARPRSRDPRRRGERRGYAVLRSYVMADRPDDGSPTDDEGQAHRTETDQAGVNRVLEYERSQGRSPREMPPKHPSYDVESSNGSVDIDRFIEVKSLSGDWREADAGMTKTQFDKAVELGDLYWLYIVERAQQDDFQLHCIQDPAGKANRFMFDPGWKQVAEENSDQDAAENCEK